MSKKINLIAEFELKENAWVHIAHVVQNTVSESRKEAGNYGYTAYFPEVDKNRLVFIECWEDEKILNLHTQTTHFKKLMEVVAPYLSKSPTIKKLIEIN